MSPNESPKGWLCRRFCSRYWYALRQGTPESSLFQSSSDVSEDEAVVDLGSAISSVASGQSNSVDEIHASVTAPPSTVLSDETIFVCFPKQMSMGIYEVQLDLDVFLSQPDSLRWQSFGLPNLLTEKCSDAKGIIEFSIGPQINDEIGATPAQFHPTGGVVFQDVQPRWVKGSFAVHQAFLLRVRLLIESYRIERWDAAVTIYSIISNKDGMGMNIKHNVGLTVMRPREDLFAKRFVFAMLIKNGPRDTGFYRLKPGQCLLRLHNDEYAVNEPHDTVEILVERDSQDMDKRLGVEFTCNYRDIKEISISLPVVFSKLGSVLSERIWLLKPFPPLKLHAVSQRFLSTWDISKQRIGKRQLLCFNRREMPPLYPRNLADEASVLVHRLSPVIFNGFRHQEDAINIEGPYDIIPALDMIVDIIPGKRLECRLFFNLEAGSHQRLAQIDASGWEPKYALTNGRLCTERDARWWYEDLQISLFQNSKMVPGENLRVEIVFVVTPQFDHFLFTREKGDQVQISYPLPRITDKTILGGNLKCSYDNTVITVMHKCSGDLDYEELRFFNSYGEDNKRLPNMHRGHELVVNFWMLHPHKLNRSTSIQRTSKADNVRFSGGLPLLPRLVHFDDESPEIFNDGDEECDSPSSSSSSGSPSIGLVGRTRRATPTRTITPENVRTGSAGGQQPNRGHTTDAQKGNDSYVKYKSIVNFLKESSSRLEVKSLQDFADEPDLDASTKGKPNISDSEVIVRSNDQDGSQAGAKNFFNKKSSDDGDGDPHAMTEQGFIDAARSNSAAGENTPDPSDDRNSDASDQDAPNGQDENADAFGDEEEESDFEAANGDRIVAGVALIDYLIEAVLHVVRYLERMSPMHYMIRFLILECIVCLTMPGAYFGGQPAQAVQSVVSNILTYPGQMVLGDLDRGVQPTSEARYAIDIHPITEEVPTAQDITQPRRQSLRDRIDLALGWRPIP